MTRRSITDREISLIKAMLQAGYANKDIQFYFNSPDRAVNSGRITEIADGSYSNSAEIAATTTEELEFFISNTVLDSNLATFSELDKIDVGDVSNDEFNELIQTLAAYTGEDTLAPGNKEVLPISNRDLQIVMLSLEIASVSVPQPEWSLSTIYHLRGLQSVLIELNATLKEAGKTVKTLLPVAKLISALIGKLQGILEAIKPKEKEEDS